MNADGSGVAQLTHDSAFADHPRFTADGRYVVYESKKGGNWEIRRIGTDGGGEVDLTRNRASDRYPATSPNGRLVAFSSNRGTSRHAHLGHEHPGQCPQARDAAQGQPVRARLGASGRQAGLRLGHAHGRHEHLDRACQRQGRPPAHAAARGRATQPVLVSRRRTPSSTRTAWSATPAGCTLSVKPLGGSPVDISPLRAPFLDTFDGRRQPALESVPGRHRRHQQRGERPAHDDDRRGRGTGRPVRPASRRTGAAPAAWPATSTCRPTTNCWSGRPQTASKPRSTPSTRRTADSSRSARARPTASSTAPGFRRRSPLSRRLIRPARCACSARAAPRSSPTSAARAWVPIASGPDDDVSGVDHPRCEQQHEPLRPPGGQDRLGQLPHQLRHDLLPGDLVGRRLTRLASRPRDIPRSAFGPRLDHCHPAPPIRSAAFSPIMIVAAFVLPRVTVGITEASATRRPSKP